MTKFNEMDRELVLQLLNNHKNVLTPEIEKMQSLLKSTSCPKCQGSNIQSFVNPKNPFSASSIVPNYLAKCLKCQIEFIPITNVIINSNP